MKVYTRHLLRVAPKVPAGVKINEYDHESVMNVRTHDRKGDTSYCRALCWEAITCFNEEWVACW